MMAQPTSFRGFCPVCSEPTTFVSTDPWFRDHLRCDRCGSIPRERAVALVLRSVAHDWRNMRVHECSPGGRGISAKIARECAAYIGTNYNPNFPLGAQVDQFRNENFENQTFPDAQFDLVLSLDVTEHLFNPAAAYRETFRTLKRGGTYVHTFPIDKWQTEAAVACAELHAGEIRHLREPEYHGNPIDERGSLVTFRYGYEIYQRIQEWAEFDVSIIRFSDRTHGILGEYTDVVVCRKPV
jgi:SAM-dependent methyltransferase